MKWTRELFAGATRVKICKWAKSIGRTDRYGALSIGHPYTPQNMLATLYRHLGIDPSTTLPTYNGRPIYLLDDPEAIRELA